jgi:NAD(P)-dependent dehydrogenase (short-subunit alcohol dehydrogenase family)
MWRTTVFDDLAGQTAVVTGGARGLGLQMARALAAQGVHVGLLDLLPEVTDSADALARTGVRTVGVPVDVTDDAAVRDGFDAVAEALGTPSLLVNAAGITIWGDSVDVGVAEWRKVLDVNLTGTFLCCQALARGLLAEGRPGAVVNVSSMSGRVVNVPQHQASYNASKAAVDALTRSLAVEWAPARIRVNAIAPGYVLSDMTRQFTESNPDLARQWVDMIPAGRMGEPEDLEALVVLLCSQRSAYLTGQSVVIDGGYSVV